MAEDKAAEQRAWGRLDERTRNVLQVMATQVATFHEQGRSGAVSFDIQFESGEIPEEGFWQKVHEKVL